MAIDAGTILAYLDLDTSKFGNALQLAQSQMTEFAQDGGGLTSMVDGMGTALTTVGRTMTMGVSVPLVGMGVAAVKTGMEFDAQMSRVKAISGATEEQFATLREAAIQMGADSVFGATDAAKALEYMGMAGWDTQQMMDGLPGIINLAAASGEELGSVSDIVTDALTAFGLSAADAAHFSDVLAAASTSSNTNVGMMGATFKYAAPLAGALGYSIEDCAVAIGLMANAGIKGEQAGTSMRAMLTNLANPTDRTADAMTALGISLTDSSGKMLPMSTLIGNLRTAFAGLTETEKAQMASDIAGKEAMSALLAIVNASEEDYQKLTAAVDDCNGATTRMAEQMLDNLSGDVEGLSGALEGLSLAFSDYVTPAIRTVVQWLTRGVDWFNSLDKSVQNIIFRAGLIAAAAGPALMVGGKLISLFSGVIPLLTLVGGGFALVYNHSERLQGLVAKLKESVPGWLGSLKTGFFGFTGALKDGQGVISAVQIGLEAAFGSKTSRKINRVLGVIQTGFKTAKTRVTDFVSGIGEFIGSLIDGEGVAESLRQALETAFGSDAASRAEGVISRIGGAFNTVKNAAQNFTVSTRTHFTTFRMALSGIASDIAEDYSEGGVMGVLSGLGGTMRELLTNGAALAKQGATAVRNKIAEGLALAKEWLAPKVQTWMTNLGDAYQSAKAYATDKLPAVKEAILNGLTAAKETVTTKTQSVMTWIGEAYRSDSVQGFLGDLSSVGTTILEKIGSAKEALTTKAGELLNALGAALGSEEVKEKVTEITGVAATIAGKITSGVGAWKTTAATLLGDLIAQLTDNGFLETTIVGLGGVVTAIADGIGNAATNIVTCASTLITTLVGKFTEEGFVSALFTTAGDVVTSIAGVLGGVASNIVSAATDIGTALIGGISSIDWATLFTEAGTVVTSIGSVLGGVAANIATAAGTLGKALIDGIVAIDWATLFTEAGTVITNIGSVLGGVATNIATVAGSLGKALIDGIAAIDWTTIFTEAGTVVTNIGSVLTGVASNVVSVATDLGKALIDGIVAIDWATLFTEAGTVVTNIGSQITAVSANIYTAAADLAKALVDGIAKVDWAGMVDTFGTIATGLLDNLVAAIPTITTSLTSIASSIVDGIAAIDWSGIGTSLGTVATNLIDGILTNLPATIEGVGPLVEKIGDAIVAAGSALSSAAGSLISGLVTWILTPSNWAKLLQAGDSIVNGICNGIINLGWDALQLAGKFVVDTVGGAVDGLATGLTNVIVEGTRALFGIEVDKELEAKCQAMFDKVYTVFDSQGKQMEYCGYALMDALSAPMLETDQITLALQAWDVALSEGIDGAFQDASWLANDSVVGLFGLLADKTLSEGERAKAAAVLIGAGYGDVFENALYMSEPQVAEAAYNLLDSANGEVQDAVAALGASLPGSIQTGLESGIPILEAAANKVAEVASGTQDKVDTLADAKAVGEEAVGAVADGEDDTGEVEDATQGVSDTITDTMEPLPGLMEELGANGITSMASGVTATQGEVETAVANVSDAAVTQALQSMSAQTGTNIGITFVRAISTGAKNMQGTLTSTIRSIGSQAVSAISGVMTSGAGNGIGRAMIQGVISGAGSMGSALNSKMRSLANSAVSAFKAAIQMHSPPKAFTDIGEAIPDAVGIGTDRNRDAAISPVVALAHDLENAFHVDLDDTNVTAKAHTLTGMVADQESSRGGFAFNFYGDMTVRDDTDVERISRQVYEDVKDILRGGGVLA